MLKVIVDRTKWFRGHGIENSQLLRSDGRMCCLGFACLAAGLSPEQIGESQSPGPVYRVEKWPETLLSLIDKNEDHCNSKIGYRLMTLNDDMLIDDNSRETHIRQEGEEAGIEFEFIN